MKAVNATAFLQEMQAETAATRKCLERISEKTFEYKPHPKSMAMGYLALLVAEIPSWITHMIEKGEIDFATYEHFTPKTTKELVDHFDKNIETATSTLQNASQDALNGIFSLKANGKLLFSSPIMDSISSTLNHWVHHRGQLTVYMRMNEIPVPSIYGPSADEPQF